MAKAPGKTLYTKDWWPVPDYNLKETRQKIGLDKLMK